jgi:hypothetical protein
MNQNDIMSQQQALLTQLMENAQRLQFASLAIGLAMLILGAWVLYMFYARLRDIGDELRKFRIAYEMAQERQPRSAPPHRSATEPPSDSR